MQEKKSQNVNLILDRLKKLSGVNSDVQLASTLGIKPNTLSQWRKRNTVDYEVIFTVCDVKGFDLNKVIGRDGYLNGYPDGYLEEKSPEKKLPSGWLAPKVVMVDQDDKELIPIVAHKAAAGYLTGYADPEYIEKLPALRMPGFSGRTYRGFEARGPSMLPNIYPGSLNIGSFVESLEEIKSRRIYIVVTKFDGIVIKRVINHKESGKIILISDNANKQEHPNFSIDPEDILELWYWRGVFNTQAPEPYDMYNQFNDVQAKVTILQEQVRQLQSDRLNKRN